MEITGDYNVFMSKDYYNILGVSKSATQEEIKKSFRKKAHEYHPDKSTGDEAKFKEINEAYQTLGNGEKRKQYDQFGQTFGNSQGFGYGGQGFSGQGFNWQDFASQAGGQSGGFRTNVNFEDFDLGDIFGDFFGGSFSRKSTRKTSVRGSDLEYRIEIDIRDSAFGAEKVINIEKDNICNNCHGKGYDASAKIITCPECRGKGYTFENQRTIFGAFQSQRACPTCQGEGKKPDKFCFKCHGMGKLRERSQLKIKIPAGINEGESIKLSGQGEAGTKGGLNGDLYITFRIKPDWKFKRANYDILSKEEINIVQASLGDKIEVATLNGSVRLKIPAGIESGKIFKLSGMGTEKLHGRGNGDQLVEIIIKTPKNISRKAKKLLEELRSEV